MTVIAAGITVFEALTAHDSLANDGISVRIIDLFSIQPIDATALRESVELTQGRVLTVEDHYAHGGIGDAVLAALAEDGVILRKLAVREITRSGNQAELMDRYGISAKYIIAAVKELLLEEREWSVGAA